MKPKTMALIGLAIACGLGAMFMTSKLLADRAQQEETVSVLVAKKALTTGEIIRKPEDAFIIKEIAKDSAPKNALTKFEEVKGRQLKIPRREGDSITQDDLHDDKSLTLMATLPPGHRAVGIRVSSEQIAAGFAAVPHSRVDIACSVKCQNDKDCGTRLILQNVLVLASGQASVRDDGGKAMLSDVVTVALVPDDALKLQTAAGKGGLTLLLRPFAESGHVKTGLMTWERTISSSKDEKADAEEGTKSTDTRGLDSLPPVSNPEKRLDQPQPQQQPPSDQWVIRITTDKTRTSVWSKDSDGLFVRHSETVAPINSPSNSLSPVREAQGPRPGTLAAPAPNKQQ